MINASMCFFALLFMYVIDFTFPFLFFLKLSFEFAFIPAINFIRDYSGNVLQPALSGGGT